MEKRSGIKLDIRNIMPTLALILAIAGCKTKEPSLVLPYGSTVDKSSLVLPYGSTVDNRRIIIPYGNGAVDNKKVNVIIKNTEEIENNILALSESESDENNFIVFLTEEDLKFHMNDSLYPPNPGQFNFTYWNNMKGTVIIPDNVWRDAFDACAWINGGVYDPKVCDATILLAIAITENNLQYPIDNPNSGACGLYQFLPSTWDMYATPDHNDCHNTRDSAFVAAIMTHALNLHNQPNRQSFIRHFAGLDGGLVWNRHTGQAGTVWDISQILKQLIATNPYY